MHGTSHTDQHNPIQPSLPQVNLRLRKRDKPRLPSQIRE